MEPNDKVLKAVDEIEHVLSNHFRTQEAPEVLLALLLVFEDIFNVLRKHLDADDVLILRRGLAASLAKGVEAQPTVN